MPTSLYKPTEMLRDFAEMSYPRPDIVTDGHLVFLDKLRESGKTNMFGATPYLRLKFKGLSNDDATKVLLYWMKTFGERHPR